MSNLNHHTFRVTFDIDIAISEIDEEVIAASQERMKYIENTDELIRRERALLDALLRHPDTLRAFLTGQVAMSLESVNADDDSLAPLQNAISDATLVDQIKEDLSADDYAFFQDVADPEVDLFYDNASYFYEAISVKQRNFTIVPMDE